MTTALAAAGASGYEGPPELTVARALTEWTLDPWMLALILFLGGAYLAGVWHIRRSAKPSRARGVREDGSPREKQQGGPGAGRPPRDNTEWPVARPIWFCGLGLGFLVIATMSWVGVYQSVLFYARAVQTVLLVLVVPLFLVLGRPVTLAARVFPRAGARLVAVIRSRPAKILTFPAITTFALVGVPFVMYFTSWYTEVFYSTTVRELTFLALMTPGVLFFWTLLRVDPVPKEYPYGVSMWITGGEVIGDAFFGIAVIAYQTLIGGAYYHALGRPWGPSLATDQVIGGGVLWILGDLVGLPFLAAVLIHMMREDESEAARIDAELNAQQAQLETNRLATTPRVADQPGESPDPGEPVADDQEPQKSQLWWETDPRFTSRFKPTS
jgi:cytochrome c oxidase assembly factor CtaG